MRRPRPSSQVPLWPKEPSEARCLCLRSRQKKWLQTYLSSTGTSQKEIQPTLSSPAEVIPRPETRLSPSSERQARPTSFGLALSRPRCRRPSCPCPRYRFKPLCRISSKRVRPSKRQAPTCHSLCDKRRINSKRLLSRSLPQRKTNIRLLPRSAAKKHPKCSHL